MNINSSSGFSTFNSAETVEFFALSKSALTPYNWQSLLFRFRVLPSSVDVSLCFVQKPDQFYYINVIQFHILNLLNVGIILLSKL